jgi:arylsulfatase A-like enzyme
VSDALLCQIDFPSTFAALTGQTLPEPAAPDSFNMLAALTGDSKAGRDHLVEHTRPLALRQGHWKLIPAESNRTKKGSGEAELYDLSQDIAETRNLAAAQPERVRQMTAELERIRSAGRTRY